MAGAPARPGGPPLYAARALAEIGRGGVVVTRCAAADEGLVATVRATGVSVTWRPAAVTTAFAFSYDGDRREMTVEAVGDPWTVDDMVWVNDALEDAAWVQVGAVLRSDFAAPALAALAAGGRRLLLDAQGLVRVAEVGALRRDAEIDPQALRSVTVLKLSEGEATALAGGCEPERLASLGVPEVVVTFGREGSLVVSGDRAERVAATVTERRFDPTGAGDVFSAGYLTARADGADPVEAARAASALVPRVLGGDG